jgi:hypothetical protein
MSKELQKAQKDLQVRLLYSTKINFKGSAVTLALTTFAVKDIFPQ